MMDLQQENQQLKTDVDQYRSDLDSKIMELNASKCSDSDKMATTVNEIQENQKQLKEE
jgi:hypothetical protein